MVPIIRLLKDTRTNWNLFLLFLLSLESRNFLEGLSKRMTLKVSHGQQLSKRNLGDAFPLGFKKLINTSHNSKAPLWILANQSVPNLGVHPVICARTDSRL